MTDKTFTIGGVSKSKNGYKVRFANDMMRVKILARITLISSYYSYRKL